MKTIKLTPEELRSQSMEMSSLKSEYENLFSNVSSILNATNNTWSANLSHNFAGKITSAQKSFSSVVDMLQYGIEATNTSAEMFTGIDIQLSKYVIGASSQTTGIQMGLISGQSSNWFEKINHSITDVGNVFRTGCAKLASGIEGTAAIWVEEYNRKGFLYKSVNTFKEIADTTFSLLGAAVAVGVTGATGGVTAPIAAIEILHASNSLANNMQDIYNLWHGDIEQVGKTDCMKILLVDVYTYIGGEIGNSRLGEIIGNGLYGIYELIPTLNGISDLRSKVIQSPSLKKAYRGLKESGIGIKEVVNGLIDIAVNSDIRNISYDFNLWKNQENFENIEYLYEIADTLKDVGSTTSKVTKSVVDYLTDIILG